MSNATHNNNPMTNAAKTIALIFVALTATANAETPAQRADLAKQKVAFYAKLAQTQPTRRNRVKADKLQIENVFAFTKCQIELHPNDATKLNESARKMVDDIKSAANQREARHDRTARNKRNNAATQRSNDSNARQRHLADNARQRQIDGFDTTKLNQLRKAYYAARKDMKTRAFWNGDAERDMYAAMRAYTAELNRYNDYRANN